MKVNVFQAAQNIVGESIVWDDTRNSLLWVDIVGRHIFRHSFDTGHTEKWSTPDLITSIGLRQDGGAIVGLRNTVARWDYSHEFDEICQIEPTQTNNRLNEGVVGPDGKFWVGTMQNNIDSDNRPLEIKDNQGSIYRVDAEGCVERVTNAVFGITNTFVWTDSSFITADTLKNEIYRYTLNEGNLTSRTVINDGFSRGLPDGACLDSEGYIWQCRVANGGCLIRIDQNGTIDKVIDLPCSSPTSCCFGGAELDTLFVTSARFGMNDSFLQNNPHEGDVFAINVGVTGHLSSRL